MIIIDVDFDTIKEMSFRTEGLSFFYTEDHKGFTIYKEFNGMLFRNYQEKEGNPMQDEVFRATYLGRARRVFRVSAETGINGNEWKRAFRNMYNAMVGIHSRLEEIEDRMEVVRNG